MNGRSPTRAEARYIDLCVNVIGCMPCRLDRPNARHEPGPSTIAFHHDSGVGSSKRDCHFRGMGLCAAHHQGVNNHARLPMRHPPGKPDNAYGQSFRERYGTDEEICRMNWQAIARLGESMKRDIMQFCPFEDLREVTEEGTGEHYE